jgi:hypothetical protein
MCEFRQNICSSNIVGLTSEEAEAETCSVVCVCVCLEDVCLVIIPGDPHISHCLLTHLKCFRNFYHKIKTLSIFLSLEKIWTKILVHCWDYSNWFLLLFLTYFLFQSKSPKKKILNKMQVCDILVRDWGMVRKHSWGVELMGHKRRIKRPSAETCLNIFFISQEKGFPLSQWFLHYIYSHDKNKENERNQESKGMVW